MSPPRSTELILLPPLDLYLFDVYYITIVEAMHQAQSAGDYSVQYPKERGMNGLVWVLHFMRPIPHVLLLSNASIDHEVSFPTPIGLGEGVF